MEALLSQIVSVAFHGTAFGMILYVISVGLSVTMGLMGFANLAHGVFAMAGGYILTSFMAQYGVPFPLALFIAALLIGVADTACKYWTPQFGAFLIYVATIGLLLWRPTGLFGRRA